MRTPLFVAAILAIASSATAQVSRDTQVRRPTGSATISGIVQSADESRTPVRLARVTLNSLEQGGAAETATTDAQGRFVFRALPAGRYALQASKRAWLDANYGASRLGRAGTPVAVADGETISGLVIPLTRGAVIAGTVRDAAGEPQPGLQVRVLRFVTRDGIRSLERPSSANLNDPMTDDEGAYRVYGLPPGEYLVAAGSRFSGSGGLGSADTSQLASGDVDRLLGASPSGSAAPAVRLVTNTPVFFPGTTDMASATTVTVTAGEERSGIDIAYALYPASRITGTITLPPGMSAAPTDRNVRAELRLTPAGFEDLLTQPLAAAVAEVGGDLRFTFAGVPPGAYTITAAVGSPGGGAGGAGLALGGYASMPVVVSGQDQDIAIAMGPGAVLRGRVVFEGGPPPKDPTSAVQVTARGFGRARLLRGEFNARPETDGTFHFSALVAGRWTFSAVLPRSSPWTLKSITLGGRQLNDFVDVEQGGSLPEMVVTFTSRPSELAGSLQDPAGRAASDYFVIVFSTDQTTWTPVSRTIQSTRPASDGAYSIKGLPAGEYFVAALTDVEPGEWLSSSFLQQIVAASVRVQIRDGERTMQSLRIAK